MRRSTTVGSMALAVMLSVGAASLPASAATPGEGRGGQGVERLRIAGSQETVLAAPAPVELATSAFYYGACNMDAFDQVLQQNGTYVYDEYPGYNLGGSPSHLCSLKAGNTGTGVRTLQRIINWCYGTSGNGRRILTNISEDGVFGSGTTAALKKVQAYEGLTADGVFGEMTANRLSAPQWRKGSSGLYYTGWCT